MLKFKNQQLTKQYKTKQKQKQNQKQKQTKLNIFTRLRCILLERIP